MGLGRLSSLASVALLVVVQLIGRHARAAQDRVWSFEDVRFRVAATVETGMYPRKDALVRCDLDFAALFSKAGAPRASLDVNSIRVAAVDHEGAEKEVPCKFLKATGFHNSKAPRGQLVWQLPGEVDPLETRRYRIYFGSGETRRRKRPAYPPIPGARRTPRNAVRNPGFEDADPKDPTQAEHWAVLLGPKAKGSLQVVREPRRTGESAMKITCTAGRSVVCVQGRVKMKPNALYRIGAWATPDPRNKTEGLQMLLTAWLYRADGRKVKTRNAKLQTSTPLFAGRWIHIGTRGLSYKGKDVPTPPDTAYCEVSLQLHPSSRKKGAEATGAAYVDDVELVEVKPRDTVPPMSVELGTVERK